MGPNRLIFDPLLALSMLFGEQLIFTIFEYQSMFDPIDFLFRTNSCIYTHND